MFKTGIVGFLLAYTAFGWFVLKAVRLARDLTEPSHVRAIAGVAVAYHIIIAISNLTLNSFSGRNDMIWIGLFWGFILSREIAKRKRQALLQTAPIVAASHE
jgi:hypothetical protein